MALIINKTGLKHGSGTDLPETGIFVKFIYQSNFEGFDQRFFLRYYINKDSKEFSSIEVLYKENELDEAYKKLPSSFIKPLDEVTIGNYEKSVNTALPGQANSTKTIFAYHLFIKEFLEDLLGEDTVDIRLDLS